MRAFWEVFLVLEPLLMLGTLILYHRDYLKHKEAKTLMPYPRWFTIMMIFHVMMMILAILLNIYFPRA